MKVFLIVGLLVCLSYAQNCILDPTTSSCSNFTLTTSQENGYITSLCDSMPWVVGCSVNSFCASLNSTYCDKFNILKDICTDVSNATECDDYVSMCDNPNSVVKQCTAAIPPLPTTSNTESYINQMCSGNNPGATCTSCTNNQTNCNLLSTYSTLCLASPSLSECSDWMTMCYEVPEWPVCFNSSCFINPSYASCATYQLPSSVTAYDISSLCNQMPYMVGCSINTLCSSGNVTQTSACSGFSILADICTEMSTMTDCEHYNQLCPTSSAVEECQSGISQLPTSTQVQGYITSMCDQMSMSGCSSCLNNLMMCDLLGTYTMLCQEMPTMSECSAWNKMCQNSALSSWSICQGSSNYKPSAASHVTFSFSLLFILFMVLFLQ